MKNIFLVIDMQNDFLSGVLGNEECRKVIPNILTLLHEKVKKGDIVIFTKDTHEEEAYPSTLEGKCIPSHCIKGQVGHDYDKAIQDIIEELKKTNVVVEIEKPTFGSMALGNYLSKKKDIDTIYVMGVCTSICVHANAVIARSALPDSNIIIYKNTVGDGNKKAADAALESMESLQIQIKDHF